MYKTSFAHHPDFDDIVRLYKERYGVDLSHMRMKWSKHPVYNNVSRSYDFDDDETGGSWVDNGTVRINPKMGPVLKRFGIDGMTQAEFRRRIIAHELAHDVWFKQNRKAKVKMLIRDSLAKARGENFTTPYLKTVPDRKIDEETFAEYMSDQLNKKAAAYTAGFLSKCAEYGVDGLALLKTAGPSLRDKASAGVPGARQKLEEQRRQKSIQAQKERENPWMAKITSRAAENRQAQLLRQRSLSRMAPEQRSQFLKDERNMAGSALRTRFGAASAALPFVAPSAPFLSSALTEGIGEAIASGSEGRTTPEALARGVGAGGLAYGVGKGVESLGRHVVAPAYRWAAPPASRRSSRPDPPSRSRRSRQSARSSGSSSSARRTCAAASPSPASRPSRAHR